MKRTFKLLILAGLILAVAFSGCLGGSDDKNNDSDGENNTSNNTSNISDADLALLLAAAGGSGGNPDIAALLAASGGSGGNPDLAALLAESGESTGDVDINALLAAMGGPGGTVDIDALLAATGTTINESERATLLAATGGANGTPDYQALLAMADANGDIDLNGADLKNVDFNGIFSALRGGPNGGVDYAALITATGAAENSDLSAEELAAFASMISSFSSPANMEYLLAAAESGNYSDMEALLGPNSPLVSSFISGMTPAQKAEFAAQMREDGIDVTFNSDGSITLVDLETGEIVNM